MEPQLIPTPPQPPPQAPTFDQPNFEAPRSDLTAPQSRQDFFSKQDQPNFSSQGFDDSPQMFSRGSMHNGGFDMFGTLLFLALLFVMARFFFGGMRHSMLGPSRGWQGMKQMRRGWGQDDALELARMRFAKGEISSEEFEMIQRALKD
jgi:uncharacterized membrane protein